MTFPVRFSMPLPPRTNALWRRGRGGGMISNPAEAAAYAASIAAVREVAARVGTIESGVEVRLVVWMERRATDADARTKAALDALAKATLLLDDVQVCRVSEERRLAPAGEGRVEVTITRCDDPDLLDAWDSRIARAARRGPDELRDAQARWAAGVRERLRAEALRRATRKPAARPRLAHTRAKRKG
jgi:Holliday junction resolvase RusA-like endonuclease